MDKRGYWSAYRLYLKRLRRASDNTIPSTRIAWPGATLIVGAQFALETSKGNMYEAQLGTNRAVFAAEPVGSATLPNVDGVEQVEGSTAELCLTWLISLVQLIFWMVVVVSGVSLLWGDNPIAYLVVGPVFLAPFLLALLTSALASGGKPAPAYIHLLGAASDGGGAYRQVRMAIINDETKPLVLSETRNPSLIRHIRGIPPSQYRVTEETHLGRTTFTVPRR
jgi:hypothetical protein